MNINDYKEIIDSHLEEYFKEREGFNKIIHESESYSINVGGKRIRPILTLLVCNAYNKDISEVLNFACGIEMIHTYSLIHDDLPCMDDDDLRRGKLTNHKVFGENIAVLAGDALLNEAMIIFMKESLDKGENYLKAGLNLATAAGSNGMIGGQVVDILSEGKNIEKEELRYMHRKKTGSLIKASITAGAMICDAREEEILKWKEYGEKLGLAFQIKDDILDILGDEKKLGKKVHADEKHDKRNYVSIYGISKCKELCSSLTEECLEILNNFNRDTRELEELTINLLKREY